MTHERRTRQRLSRSPRSAYVPRYDVPALTPRFLLLAVLLLAVAGLPGPAGAQAPATRPGTPYQMLFAGGRRPLQTVLVGDQEMVGLDDLAGALSLSLRDDPLAGGMTVSYKGKTVALMPDQTLASVGGRLISMPAPFVREGKRWLVPIEFIPRALALVYDTRLELRKTVRFVVIGDLRVPRLVVRFETSGSQVRFTFDTFPRTVGAVTQEQNRLLIRFEADALDTAFPPLVPQGLVETIRLGDAPGTVALVLGPRFGSYKVSAPPTDATSARLVVELQPMAEPTPPAPPPPTPQELSSLAAAQTVRTVVIDPGHGGTEDGARGASGALEKDVTLSVARKLKSAIENRLGLRALLTRDGDALVTLDERAAFANNNKADLLISLHANASLRKGVKGAQVFYLSPDGYDAQQATTTAATFPTFGGGSREIDVILWEVAQRQHLAQSAAFAALVEEELRTLVPMSGQPVQQAPFRVLVGANMPAVLIEMGFLTNAEQEETMASAEFQNAIVQALLNAVVRYRDTVERGRVATTPSAVRAPGRP